MAVDMYYSRESTVPVNPRDKPEEENSKADQSTARLDGRGIIVSPESSDWECIPDYYTRGRRKFDSPVIVEFGFWTRNGRGIEYHLSVTVDEYGEPTAGEPEPPSAPFNPV
ncbi:hypothetical protein [Halostagnicola sp. A-GB9-2]|uniref:hypothetical protein n=1 Tax=Halostagnicola sp. A-GB9-2 TaxID=3048066 RepID=UPI0024BF9F4B|nr:hypothetical protein [Halostagnicola sp. A-GB9-2]MDJ1432426.1 hypothetical protein [Halostagnicola sp. A-GB9-2]